MARHDLGLVVRHLEISVCRADQSPDVATVGEIDGVIAAAVGEGIAGVKNIGVGEINPRVAIGVGVVDMREQRFPAADFHRL